MSSSSTPIFFAPPAFLAIGHVTRDLQPDGSFTLGGTVSFAGLCAARLGLTSALITHADTEMRSYLTATLPEITSLVHPSPVTTTFANHYHNGFRTQYLYARAEPLTLADIPADWFSSSIVLFAPLAQEITAELVLAFPRQTHTLLAATPQGWLRSWQEDGKVRPTIWKDAERILPHLDVLILSHDDLLPLTDDNRHEADALLKYWSSLVPLLIATAGKEGATLFQEGKVRQFPAYPVTEVDPTGAGDVFAAAFLTHLHHYHNPEQAVDFANCAASFAVQKAGLKGIPTREMVEQRWHSKLSY